MNNDPKSNDTALPEDRMPEPAPGRRVISFSLPAEETPVKKRARKPRVQQAVDEYTAAADAAAEESLAAAFAAFNKEDYRDLSATPRRRGREVALLILFAATRGADLDETWTFARNILRDTGLAEDNAVFALELARQAYERREECDRLLAAYARDWSPDRFPAVDLCILRLACAELLEGGAAATVVINEAVELAKKFSAEDSAPFVNGMLDNIYKFEIKDKQDRE
ncbi:MAG: transcription antitermination factor NusB [Firmicutes bacterium]|nr:transcription antitermination factor NusB [Bacillota bacterium]